ncbi:hypothetical protein GOV14_01190 [Candidatus Pacearchaeota archaeon]|nr:hypothetical protein [Candidatus Pacearchaeota archaeon]
MVNEPVLIKNKWRVFKKVLKIFIIVLLVLIILIAAFLVGFFLKEAGPTEILILNPMSDLILENTDSSGTVNEARVVELGVINFNASYIDYILIALGSGHLRKSPLTFENPKIEVVLDGEVWGSVIKKGTPNTGKGEISDEDLQILLSKEEAVRIILSKEPGEYMKDSVSNGRTEIELVAGKVTLFAKGYLEMYTALTGDEVDIDSV